MGVARSARCATRALLTLVVVAFVMYCCLIPFNVVLLSPWLQELTALCPFPYIGPALQASAEEKAVSSVPQDRLYSAAVRNASSCGDSQGVTSFVLSLVLHAL